MEPIIRLENINKHFGTVFANRDINLEIIKGEVHSIVGENGAGKSTLMNILYGMVKPDSGNIYYEGKKCSINTPHDAIKIGIGMVHQHFMLVPSLTVMENIVLGLPPKNEKIWRPDSFRPTIQEIVDNFGLSVDLDTKVENLSVGMKQRVEILKVLYHGAKIIILDEPTAILTPQETEELFSTIKMLQSRGHTIIFISHKLREVMTISDRISALRNGKLVNTVNKLDVTAKDVACMMIGSNLEPLNRANEVKEKVNLSIDNLCVESADCINIHDISFELYAGEVLGVAGVEGNGQSTLVETIIGARNKNSGSIYFNGDEISKLSIKKRIESGLAHIPEDRMSQGLALDLSIEKNMIVGVHDKAPIKKNGVIKWSVADDICKQLVEDYSVKTEYISSQVSSLSGGNMQKVVVARELHREPSVIIACQPTRGVDIGSSKYIRECLLNVKKTGGSVLLVSADLDELLEMSDRILVMYDGRITGIINASEATENQLGELMFGKISGE